MAPMNWSLLFTAFIGLYMICMIVIYYTSNLPLASKGPNQLSVKEIYMTWKW